MTLVSFPDWSSFLLVGLLTWPTRERADSWSNNQAAADLIDQDDSLLPRVERVSEHIKFGESVRFTAADEFLVYSTWQDGDTARTLRVIPTAEPGKTPPRTVVADFDDWALSADGQTVFFQRGVSPPGATSYWGQGPGALWATDFPSGAEPMEIASGVVVYGPVSRTWEERGHRALPHR